MKFTTKTENQIAYEEITKIKDGDISEYLVKIELKEKARPEKYSIIWEEDQIDLYGFWSSKTYLQHYIAPDWYQKGEDSRTASGMPLIAFYNKANENRVTVALSDTMNPINLTAGVVEETGTIQFKIDLFAKVCPATKEYSVIIRIDRTKRPLYKSIMDAREWWSDLGYKSAYVPEHATLPMYSCWYSFHQHTIPEEIIKECKIAKEYGMDTVIVDDGWQTDDNSRGYAYCGDWEICEAKIPDMKGFVDKIHDLGMKFMIWYSVPFVGFYSKSYKRFKGMYLTTRESQKTAVLDPRFKEVRDYLTNIYATSVEKYGWDGLKLDFIDSFMLDESSSCDYDKMDTVSVEEGLQMLLKETTEKLKKINPDILIEFRQSYVGPAIASFGNMFRVGDCPNDPIMNRVSSLNLRLTSGKTAVHSDMLMWNKDETNEAVMYQLLSIMFSVPQISVRFDNITDDHKVILKNYLSFWREKRDIILNGELSVYGMEANYTLAQSKKDGTCVAVLYQNVVKKLENVKEEYIFNATGDSYIYVEAEKEKSYEIYDYFGNKIKDGTFATGISKLPVENCQMVKII